MGRRKSLRASPDRAQKHIETAKHRKKESILTKYRKSRDLKTEIKDRMKVKEELTKIFGEKEVRILLEDCKGSQRDLSRVIKWMRQCFGRKHFGLHSSVRPSLHRHLFGRP